MNSKFLTSIAIIFSLFLVGCSKGASTEETKASEELTLKTHSRETFSFQTPGEFGTEFSYPMVWPPNVKIAPGTFTCDNELKTIAGREYCFYKKSESLSGNTYNDYVYTALMPKMNSLVTVELSFSLNECNNYKEPNKTKCIEDQSAVDSRIDQMIGQLIDSIIIF